ncbi:methyltransferase domain-containing protein [Candidatus Kuenenbacteria bacterium]|nr:methyltransferase domain-containing protein [Candidatus Kuenenbacteria bacterium]
MSDILNFQNLLEKVGLKQNMIVGDLGCGGSGYFVVQAARMVGKDGIVYAVDILKPVLKSIESKARLEKVYNIKTIWSNLEIYKATKIKDEELNVILLTNIVHQAKDPSAVFREAIRMLKKDGKILVIEWEETSALFGPKAEHRISKKKIKEIAEQNNLKKEEEFKAGNYHYGIIFKKK